MGCEQRLFHHSIPVLEIQTKDQIIHNCLPYEYISRKLHHSMSDIIFYKIFPFHLHWVDCPCYILPVLFRPLARGGHPYWVTSPSHQTSRKARTAVLVHMPLSLQQTSTSWYWANPQKTPSKWTNEKEGRTLEHSWNCLSSSQKCLKYG